MHKDPSICDHAVCAAMLGDAQDTIGGAHVGDRWHDLTLSSALGALVGSARVIQALAKDNLLPCLRVFAHGSASDGEPRRAIVLSWCIAQVRVAM